jgi:coatomer protein complex subunit epsilon
MLWPGGSKLEEAHAIFQDMSEKYDSGKTPLILNGSAACLMAMGKFDEAEKELLEALAKVIRRTRPCEAKPYMLGLG